MTEGISKERLTEIARKYSPIYAKIILDIAEFECTELDPWLPIDENTPKDKPVFVWSEIDGQNVAYWSTSVWVDKGGSWIVEENRSDTNILHPTHYKLLPEDPK